MFRLVKSCLRHRALRTLVALLAIGGFLCLFILFIFLFHFERKALDYDIKAVGLVPMNTQVLDATNTTVGYLHRAQGSDLPLEQISRDFLNALIAREDARFWKHHGVDHIGMVRANVRNIKDKRFVQGASTITMQLSRMTFDLKEEMKDQSISRKLVEMALARRIERNYSKQEILRLYANRIFLGTGMHGIEEASDGYFGKHPSKLNLSEAAMIAGIIRAPNGVSPFRYPDAALREMRTTLDRMVVEGMITDDQAEEAKKNHPKILPQDQWMEKLRAKIKTSQQTWFLDMIESKMAEIIPGSRETGGFIVKCTVDHRLQKAISTAVRRWLTGIERSPGYRHPVYPAVNEKREPTSIQGAGVLIDNHNGAIRALIGGRDYRQSAFNRAIHKNRQAGSIIKPLVYATAFETGMFPGSNVSDEKIGPKEFRWWPEPWSPLNADKKHEGVRPAEEGLIKSRNTMTVRVGETAGIENVNRMFSHAGIAEDGGPKDPQIYIGNIAVSLLAMTSAYTAFPMQGIRHQPFLIEEIIDRDGNIVFRHEAEKYQLFSPEAAWMTSSILQKVVQQGGTGASLRSGFNAPAGGKTGTTNDFVDAWFVGYTSRLTGGFWVGLDKPQPMVAGAYGSTVAMPMWRETMNTALSIGYKFKEFKKPSELFKVELCRNSGLLASPECKSHGCAYVETVPASMIPKKHCDWEAK